MTLHLLGLHQASSSPSPMLPGSLFGNAAPRSLTSNSQGVIFGLGSPEQLSEESNSNSQDDRDSLLVLFKKSIILTV